MLRLSNEISRSLSRLAMIALLMEVSNHLIPERIQGYLYQHLSILSYLNKRYFNLKHSLMKLINSLLLYNTVYQT